MTCGLGEGLYSPLMSVQLVGAAGQEAPLLCACLGLVFPNPTTNDCLWSPSMYLLCDIVKQMYRFDK